MIGSDDLSMAPEIIVGLESKVQNLNADHESADRILDSPDLPSPVALVMLETAAAVEQISVLLQEIPLAQPPCSATPERDVLQDTSPELWVPSNVETLTEQPEPVHLPVLPKPLFQVKQLIW